MTNKDKEMLEKIPTAKSSLLIDLILKLAALQDTRDLTDGEFKVKCAAKAEWNRRMFRGVRPINGGTK